MAAASLTRAEWEARSALISNVKTDVALRLSDSPAAATFASRTRLEFDCRSEGASTFLDLTAKNLAGLRVNGKKVDLAGGDLFDGHRVYLRGLKAGRNHVEVDADCFYQSDGSGLTRSVDPADGRVYMYTQAEPDDAHKIFACFDQPDLKTGIALQVDAPDGVFANYGWYNPQADADALRRSAGTRQLRLSDGMVRTIFPRTALLPTYLAHLSAGPYFVRYDNFQSSLRTEPMPLYLGVWQSQRELLEKNHERLFDYTKRILSVLEDRLGPYAFPQYGQLFVHNYRHGAMENAGLTTITDSLLPQGRISMTQWASLVMVMAHEAVHQVLFGNVVTFEEFSDLFLNETPAEVLGFYVLAQLPEFAHLAWPMFGLQAKTRAIQADQKSSTHPVANSIQSMEEAGTAFDQLTYEKGASVVRQLMALLGDDLFFAGLREYRARYEWSNATDGNFVDVLQEVAAAAGKRLDLHAWWDQYFHTTGVNTLRAVVNVSRGGKVKEFSVLQSAEAGTPTLRQHQLTVGVYDLDPSGALVKRCSVKVLASGKKTRVLDPRVIGQKQPALLLVNEGDEAYAKIRFDSVSLQTLQRGIGEIGDPLARSVAWASLWDMTRDGELAPKQFVELVRRHAPGEGNPVILDWTLNRAITAAKLYSAGMASTSAQAAIADAAQKAMLNGNLDSESRLYWLRTFMTSATAGDQLDALEDVLAGNVKVPGIEVATDYDLAWQAVLRLSAMGRLTPDEVQKYADSQQNQTSQDRALAAIASMPDAKSKAQTWDRLMNDRTLSLAAARAMSGGVPVGGKWLGGFNQPGQEKLLAEYAPRYFAAVAQIWKTHSESIAEDLTEGLYPSYTSDSAVVRRTRQTLQQQLPVAARRALIDQGEELERTLRIKGMLSKGVQGGELAA